MMEFQKQDLYQDQAAQSSSQIENINQQEWLKLKILFKAKILK